MKRAERLQVLIQLGNHLNQKDEFLDALMHRTEFNNPWFTQRNQALRIQSIVENWLTEDKLYDWIAAYNIPDETKPKTIGIVMAGNIPLTGFHDILCTFMAGHRAQIKLSDKDKFVLPYLIKLMTRFNPQVEKYFSVAYNLKAFDAIITTITQPSTGSYYERYFGKYPNILRQARRSVAVLTGNESDEELVALGKDIFQYFGLSSRNISKVYVPKSYDFEVLLKTLHKYKEIVLHSQYKNNFDYTYSLMILNKHEFKANGAIILTENNHSLQSGIANLFYEFYSNAVDLQQKIEAQNNLLEMVVSKTPISDKVVHANFGQIDRRPLNAYMNGIDIMAFLLDLK